MSTHDRNRERDEEETNQKKPWHQAVLSEISPVYVIALIAAAAVVYSQVNDLKVTVKSLNDDRNNVTIQLLGIRSQSDQLESRMNTEFDRLTNNIKHNADVIDDSMKETRERLRSIEHALARMATGTGKNTQ